MPLFILGSVWGRGGGEAGRRGEAEFFVGGFLLGSCPVGSFFFFSFFFYILPSTGAAVVICVRIYPTNCSFYLFIFLLLFFF